MRRKIKIVNFLFYYTILFKHIYSEIKFSSIEAFNCLKKNSFDNIINASKLIGSPSVCHSVSKQCCFINITHYYGDY